MKVFYGNCFLAVKLWLVESEQTHTHTEISTTIMLKNIFSIFAPKLLTVLEWSHWIAPQGLAELVTKSPEKSLTGETSKKFQRNVIKEKDPASIPLLP